MSLENFTVATFSEHVGERFRIHLDAPPPLQVELIEAAALGGSTARAAAESGQRAPFSIVFRGPRDIPLSQRIYRLEHDAIGTFDLFLVPLGPDQHGLRYEAVFN